MNLKDFARSHRAGGITWWLMPYTTLRVEAVSSQFHAIAPRDSRGMVETSFVAIEAYAVDAEFAETLTPAEARFAAYWRARPAALDARWMAFTFIAMAEVTNGFWDAFAATRDTAIERAEEAAATASPNLLPASENF